MSSATVNYSVGQLVRFRFGNLDYDGTIVSERNVGSTIVMTIEVPADPYDPLIFEIPYDDIRGVAASPPAPTLDQIIDFFINGGLLSILRADSGGRNQPRIWLRKDSRGNVTYTFEEIRGAVGGEIVPSGAVEEESIFLPRKPAVIQYLKSFGLTDEQANKVVEAIGTNPS